MKWLKHPSAVLLYGAFGGILGGLAGPFLYIFPLKWIWSALDVSYRGFASILDVFVLFLSVILGGITGCGLVHSFGKYRRFAAGGLICFGLVTALLLLFLARDYVLAHDRRFALAVFGVGFVWAILLVVWGSYISAKSGR